MSSRAAVLRPTPGHEHRASTSSSKTAVDSAAGESAREDGQRQRRPDPVRAEQRLEAPALVVVEEAVEDDRVLPDVGVHVEERLGARSGPSAAAVGVGPSPGSRRRRPRRSPRTRPARATTVPRSEPIMTSPPPWRGAGDRAPQAGACRWQTARARASAASGGDGGVASPRAPCHHPLDLLLGGAPVPDERLLDLVGAVLGHLAAGLGGGGQGEPAGLADRHGRLRVRPERTPARRRPRPGDTRP